MIVSSIAGTVKMPLRQFGWLEGEVRAHIHLYAKIAKLGSSCALHNSFVLNNTPKVAVHPADMNYPVQMSIR